MIYPKDFESKIGFARLRNEVSRKCETAMGAALVEEMEFMTDLTAIAREIGKVDELKTIINAGFPLPQFSLFDVGSRLKEKRAPGSFLSAEQLYEAAVTFHTMRELRDFFCSEKAEEMNCGNLRNEFKELPEFRDLEREIFRCIEKDGFVKDNASPQLSEIRRGIDSMTRSMHKIMRRVLDASIAAGVVDKDSNPVIREGRMVIPVSAANKKGLPGIVHDSSATGKTVFVEPAEVVEAGNKLKELRHQEELEIITVLTALTDLLRPHADEVARGCRLLADYDFIKAKALFAIDTDGQRPVLEKSPELDWFHAVHPGLLLALRAHGREVVPLNLKLDHKRRMLIISGPNAGGKSVALKTVGVVQYMLQSGLLPTLYSNSHMGVFDNIFIDIGDEQSIENDLSTYSSHLANMKFFLRNANKSTLVLADEIGSGTEPQIGEALARSILEQLGKTGCFGIITTHYQNLKMFAEKEEGFVNGAMLYDRQKLQPTFQLAVGEPGSSFALDIAAKIGLPKVVIDHAKAIVGTEYVDSERFLLDIQRDKRYWKNKRLEIKEKENRLNRLLEDYESKADELKLQRSSIIKEAKLEAKEILNSANTRIERSIHEIRKSQAEKEKSKAVRKELEDYKKELESEADSEKLPDALKPLKHKSRKKREAANNLTTQDAGRRQFAPGDFVKMENGGVAGTVIAIEGNKAEVAFGNLRTKIDINKLQSSAPPKQNTKTAGFAVQSSVDSSARQRQLNFKTDIDVRGFRADEALQAITYFLDDALQFNARRVRILHGTGHGILRSLIREQLRSNPNVKSFADEDVRFGGAGITVIDLD